MNAVLHPLCALLQFCNGFFTPILAVGFLRRFVKPRSDDRGRRPRPSEGIERLGKTILLELLAFALSLAYWIIPGGIAVAVAIATGIATDPANPSPLASLAFYLTHGVLTAAGYFWVHRQGTDTAEEWNAFGVGVRFRFKILQGLGTVLVLGLSLLPLSALLLAFPAVMPQESVLSDAVGGRPGFFRRTFRRVAALASGFVVFLAILACSVELVSRLPLGERGSFAVIPRTLLFAPADLLYRTDAERKAALDNIPSEEVRALLKTPLHEKLPPAMVEHWQFVFLAVYGFDVLLLLFIGKVPLAYNLRNVRVRWKTNAMTAVAFAAVIALLSFLLAFVNGMNSMTENTGIPGNVFVLSDGSTDEIFSSLDYKDMGNLEQLKVGLDEKNRPLKVPVGIKRKEFGGKVRPLASWETFYSINQPVPNSEPPRRRFVQLRTLEDPLVAAEVHGVALYPGGRWMGDNGVETDPDKPEKFAIECVLGEGIAETLGPDYGKKRLATGDTFQLGEMTWKVIGVMNSEGKTYGSEIWAKRIGLIYKPFGKEKPTTLIMRTEADTKGASRKFAHELNARYTQHKLKAYSEPDYFAELTKTNNFFLTAIILVCVVMAIGGVFGMMTTMFATIASRIRDIGVLRLLGFKRWQVTVSFLLESLAVAAIGGALGCAFAWLVADGRSSVSMLSAGGNGPGGKSVALTINVDAQVIAMGMLFTLVMGRLGGLVPALSAMRIKILDSLR